MDLCLRGSQINLAERQKPKAKPKFTSHSSLFGSTSLFPRSRPQSATQFQRRNRSSVFGLRPQSADPRFGRNPIKAYGQYCPERDYADERGYCLRNNQKHLQSLSSTNLLKLLIDEPIKRSWLCRSGSSVSPEDNESELSLNRRNRSESVSGSSRDGDFLVEPKQKPFKAINSKKPGSGPKMSTSFTNLTVQKTLTTKTTTSDYWLSMTPVQLAPKSEKPDLPGRVSFSKPSTILRTDLDSSDCENDKPSGPHVSSYSSSYTKSGQEGISDPGPVPVTTYNFNREVKSTSEGLNVNTQAVTENYDEKDMVAGPSKETTGNTGLKKSVHFGSVNDSNGEVVAETYEYPKCPSENCSCSTRSSSTASVHDGLADSGRCACDSSICKYSMDSSTTSNSKIQSRANLTDFNLDLGDLSDGKEEKPSSTSAVDDLPVIREYKNAVGDKLENSVVKNILDDGNTKNKSTLNSLNNMEIPPYLGKYSSQVSLASPEKQNNLSETKSNLATFKSAAKRNLLSEPSTSSNAKVESTSTGSSSSETVINNYLKVTSSPPFATQKKKENTPVKPSSGSDLSYKKRSPPLVKGRLSSAKMKKAISIGNLREDTNLSEFQIDKVDSWMSMHEEAMSRKPSMVKHSSLDDDLEKFAKDSLNDFLGDGDDTTSQVSSKSEPNSQEDSTYEEIVSVIKEIDEDKKKENFAECPNMEMDLKLNTHEDREESEEVKPQDKEKVKSPDKYKDILSYLDNVEDSCDKTLLETRRSIPETNRSEVEFIVEPDIVEDVPKLSDLLLLPNHQLARRIVALSLRANELANAVLLSKEQVSKMRTEKQKGIRQEKANTTNRIREQKKYYESIVQRHQGFIEQLLKDKGSLCEKVAALTRRLESQNQAWEHKLEAEVARVKETTLAGEKIRRERWVRENTKKIKELTVKGIEMEINKMNCQHQQDVTELKRAHQQQMLEALEEARMKHEQIETSIRESCAQDRESIIEKERTAIRERFERQLEEERKSFDEQKKKLIEDFASQRDRLQNELKAKDIEYQSKRQDIQREKEDEMDQAILEMQEKMSKQEEKYQNRINTIEKQYEADFEIWKRDYENSVKLTHADKENAIRQHYRAERDRQIDAIVCRMDAESMKSSEEYEAKLQRLKDKYDKDLQDAENVEKSLRDKYTEIRNKLAESDAQARNHEAEVKQLRLELEHSKKMCKDFITERDQYRDNVRNEIQTELGNLKSERDYEIQKIHKRVQQAIEKKDTTIDILQKENGALRERCLKLEAVIRQQRKDYCVK